MPRPRTPIAKAKASGADVKNPQRHRDRAAPKGIAQLGPPPTWLSAHGKKAWVQLQGELPWLKESHRGLMEIVATLRGEMIEGKGALGLARMQELRRCYAQLGATPADESKVAMGDGEDEDPDEALFKQPAAQPAAGRPH